MQGRAGLAVENFDDGEDMAEVLVVASKVKNFIKEKSGMNTSATVMEALSKAVERECERAIENAKKDKRKTVMDRDFTSR